MALSGAVKMKILRVFGLPFGTLDPASINYSNVITRILNETTPDAENEIIQLLDWIDGAEANLAKLPARAGVKAIDDIEFFENGLRELQVQKRGYIRDLANLLGLPGLCISGGYPTMGSVIV